MPQTKMRTVGMLAVIGALATPVRAQAQVAPPPVAPPAKILVLGFYENNKLDPVRRQQVAETIINEQLGTALQPGLADKDLSCLKASCLEDLAKQWNEADYIVGGAIFEIPPDKIQYEIQAWLYRVNITPEEKLQGVQRQFSVRKTCKADEYPTCLRMEVESLIKGRPVQERLRAAPPDVLNDGMPPKEGGTAVATRSSCSRWNFARAATLGASIGLLGSGLIAGTFVAAKSSTYEGNDTFSGFKGQKYSAIGFSVAALALIPGGLALGRPSLFFPSRSTDANGVCSSAAQTRWTSTRGAAVGLFSGLLVSGLVALIGVSANQNSHCVINQTGPCDFTSSIALSGAISATWALGMTLSLAIPSRASAP